FYDLDQQYLPFVKQTITYSKNFGDVSDVYTGFDLSISARVKEIIIQSGISAGHEVVDVCDVAGKVNDIAMTAGGIYGPPGGPVLYTAGNLSLVSSPSTLYCRMDPPFLPDGKVLAVVPLPWWGLR